ncbi:uncharacterized protein LOC134764865 [Penaeus indicus]|uniref:uncharacterized protein LOC134764865 n=1 Tax=Penaeus indicus TaxID=29960 RepID=UPI00300DA377
MNSSNQTPAACEVDAFIAGWKTGALAVEVLTSALGVVGSGLSLWCLMNCRRIQGGMKLQLFLFFSLLLLTNSVAMPGAAVAELWAVQCRQASAVVSFGLIAFYTIAATMERNAFALMAGYRLVAVCWPHKYKMLSLRLVVALLNGFVLGGVVILWLVVFAEQDLDDLDVNNPSGYKMGRELYIAILFTPMVAALIAYVTVIVVITFRKQFAGELERGRPSMREQVSFAVGILIITNLLLDLPHMVVHLMGIPSRALSFILIHVIYRLHLALDPFIFIGANLHYRRKVLLLAIPRCSLPKASTTGASSIGKTTAGSVARPASTHTVYDAGSPV